MFYHQTVQEYLDNPMGKGSTAIANRNLIKSDLDSRYNKLLERYKDFKHYKFFDGSSFYFHFLIPSESERKNTYDVVIELSDPDNSFNKDMNLNRYYMRVFSNCPSFVFTYAYTFDSYSLLINKLKDKYDDLVFKSNPVIKNPGNIINFEKSIYFACKYLATHKALMNKLTLATTNSVGLVKHLKTIRNTDVIMREIKREENRISREKKKEREIIKTQKTSNANQVVAVSKMRGTKQSGVNRVTPHSKIKPVKKT